MIPLRLAGPGRAGFSLVEVVIAIGLLTFALTAIVGLLTVGVDAGGTSKELVRAVGIASQAVAERRPAPTLVATNLLLPPLTGNTSGSNFVSEAGQRVADATQAAFLMEWTYTIPAAPTNIAYVSVRMRWPPQAPATTADTFELPTAILLPRSP